MDIFILSTRVFLSIPILRLFLCVHDLTLYSSLLCSFAGGQIKATMFNQTADKFYPVLQENKVFIISKGNLKLANKKYCRLPNEYELTLNDDAEIELCEEDDEIEQQRFDFASTEQIRTLAAEDFCDVIGVVTQVQPVASIVSQRTQKELVKRTITLVDQSMLAIDLTLWGSNAEKWNEDQLMNNVVACKQAKVSDYGGKSLNCSFNSQFFVNPQRDETNQLQNWYAQQGKNAQFTSLSGQRSGAGGSTERKTFGAVKDENMGMKEKPDYFNTRGTITFLKKDMEKAPWYNACPSDGCNKKVTEDQNGGFWCEKCNKNYDNFVPRYILSLMCCDSTGSQWLTAFNESAEILLGKTAHEMLQLKNAGADEAYNAVFDAANFKTYMFKIKAKAEASPEGEMRLRCTCINANPIDYVSESNYLLEQIRQAE